MQTLQDKVAVITGAASGIGRALAEQLAHEGMRVVLADVEADALQRTAAELKAAGATTLAVQTDVSKHESVEALARQAVKAFGGVHVLCNNAGIAAGSSIWESTQADWEWAMGVNFWGVLHGIRVFVPLMLAQDTECHIVNTGSVAGLISPHPWASYGVTKHAVVALSEQLYHELVERNAKIGVTTLCPGWVNSNLLEAARNRPDDLQNDQAQDPWQSPEAPMKKRWRPLVESGITPSQVAAAVVEAIKTNTYYVFTHKNYLPWIQARTEELLAGKNPENLSERFRGQ